MKLRDKIKYHYELSKKLSKEYDTAYTEIVVYLRTSSLGEIDAEDAIGDVLTMLLEGQEREAPVEEILGNSLKDFCDNIISSYGKGKLSIRLGETLRIAFLLIIVSTFWSYTNIELPKIIKGLQSWQTFNFSLAMLLNIIVMSISAMLILRIALHSDFEKPVSKRAKLMHNTLFGLSFVGVTACLVISGIWLGGIVIFKTNIFVVIIIIAAMYAAYRYMEPNIS